MSIFFRSKAPTGKQITEARSTDFVQSFIGGQYNNSSYVSFDFSNMETSMQSIAIRAAMDLLASLASELPKHVYAGTGANRKQMPMPAHLEDPSGDGNGLQDWCYQVLISWLGRGNLYGEILKRSPSGTITQVLPYHPDEVQGSFNKDGTVAWTVCGRPVNSATFLHRRVNPMPGRVMGLSPLQFHATQVGTTLAAGNFGYQWFREGAHPSSLLMNEQDDLTPQKAQTAKDRFMAAMSGRREPVVLGRSWKYQPIQVSAEESQFLATQGYTEAQCARIFGPGIAEVLGYDTGGSNTYANVNERSAHLLIYSLNKWLNRLERLLTEMLPPSQYVKIDRDALLQSTTMARYQAHEIALRNQFTTVNEVRSDEDKPPVPWGEAPNPVPGVGDGTPDIPLPRQIAEMIQKIYLGVGKVITADEAREILNEMGADLPADFVPDPVQPSPFGG